jgi:outer membrane receptor for ferrienterochelin and colicins
MSINLKLMDNKLNITAGAKNLFNVTSIGISGVTGGGVHTANASMNAGRGTSVFMGINYLLDFSFKNHEK